MVDVSEIKEHMEVVGSDGGHVGTVDKIEGDTRIKLTKKDPASGGTHHYLPIDAVETIEGGKLRLDRSAADAKRDFDQDLPAGEQTS
jgi:hypothetical protein